jgi:hypothetical protein
MSDAITRLARPEILALKAYSHASWNPGLTRLHANEAPWRQAADSTLAGLNRYPEPQPALLVSRLAALYGVASDRLLVTRGSDEAIDLLSRIFLRAGRVSKAAPCVRCRYRRKMAGKSMSTGRSLPAIRMSKLSTSARQTIPPVT